MAMTSFVAGNQVRDLVLNDGSTSLPDESPVFVHCPPVNRASWLKTRIFLFPLVIKLRLRVMDRAERLDILPHSRCSLHLSSYLSSNLI